MSFRSIESPSTSGKGYIQGQDSAPPRILMAPGPSNLHPRVVQALIAPLVGHKDPYFLDVLEDTAALLRQVFQTRNRATLALPTTGGGGMEASLVNLLEPGDAVVIGAAGFFAQRMVEIGLRQPGVRVVEVRGAWGSPVDNQQLIDAVREHRPRVLAVVHGETSTGVQQPFDGLAEVCRETGAMLVVDAVATLGGVDLPIDELGIDVCFSGSQKCLSAPPGLAPITVSDRAVHAIEARKTPVQSWYLDLRLHAGLWGPEHIYHHTSPVLGVYALGEALRLVVEEGLERRFARHCLHQSALAGGVEELGLQQFAAPGFRVPSVVTVQAPNGVSALAVRKQLLEELNLEVSAGLGEHADSMWRVGVMGHSAQRANIMLLLSGLEDALRRHGYTPPASAAPAAAAVYARSAG
jgi:alanine-glyoxylate transaminase/serine-glyoxylate transaminase/serine-pyruvate transaminase